MSGRVGRRLSGWLRESQKQALTLLAAVPFALLVNSSRVNLMTHVDSDGSGARQIVVDAAPYFKTQMPKWVDDTRAGHPWDMRWQSENASACRYVRDFRVAALDQLDPDTTLEIRDVLQDPLSLYTTYTWHETVRLDYLYVSDPLAAGATAKVLYYTVFMPGAVTDTSVQPGSHLPAQTEGRKVTFALDASVPTHTLTVTAQRVRWGYLLIVLYVLSYVAYRASLFGLKVVRTRPRKI